MGSTIKTATLIATMLILFSIIPLGTAQDHALSYQLLNQPEGNVTYELNVVIPVDLHEFYLEQSHRLTSSSDFPTFVTPYVLQPIAGRLWEIYDDDEDFANGVLMMVHQITYVEIMPAKYPVETMVDGQGDCDLFSFIAASVIKALVQAQIGALNGGRGCYYFEETGSRKICLKTKVF